MREYKLRVANSEVYEWTSEGEGNHLCCHAGFTLGKYETVDDAKAELYAFFGQEPDYGAYEGDNFLTCDRLEDEDRNLDHDGKYLVIYTVVLEKVSAVAW